MKALQDVTYQLQDTPGTEDHPAEAQLGAADGHLEDVDELSGDRSLKQVFLHLCLDHHYEGNFIIRPKVCEEKRVALSTSLLSVM